jgi:hypothetical protein
MRCGDVSDGTPRLRTPLADTRFAAGGRALIGFDYTGDGRCVRGFDVPTGEEQFAIAVDGREAWEVSPDGRAVLAVHGRAPAGRVENFIRGHGLPWPFAPADDRVTIRLYDAATGRPAGEFTAARTADKIESSEMPLAHRWTADGRTLAVAADADHPNVWDLWDVPPRPPLMWLAAAAGLLAVPIAGLTWRRTRRLRSLP